MGLLSSIVGAATAGMDMFVGGQLTKAKLKVEDDEAKDLKDLELEFQFNPEEIKITRQQATMKQNTSGKADVKNNGGMAPHAESRMVLKNVIFDTYEEKPNGSVYEKYVKTLEKMLGYDKGKHAPCQLAFHWGAFTKERTGNARILCRLDKLDVDYTMFLNDGKPVRCKIAMEFRVGLTADEQQKAEPFGSPDHAKLWTVKRGDTLADIASEEYDNPGEWRRIADANGIDDPLTLTPGMKLLVPPILT